MQVLISVVQNLTSKSFTVGWCGSFALWMLEILWCHNILHSWAAHLLQAVGCLGKVLSNVILLMVGLGLAQQDGGGGGLGEDHIPAATLVIVYIILSKDLHVVNVWWSESHCSVWAVFFSELVCCCPVGSWHSHHDLQAMGF